MMKKKTNIKRTVRKSKWQTVFERMVKKGKQALRVASWMAIGAVLTWIVVMWK